MPTRTIHLERYSLVQKGFGGIWHTPERDTDRMCLFLCPEASAKWWNITTETTETTKLKLSVSTKKPPSDLPSNVVHIEVQKDPDGDNYWYWRKPPLSFTEQSGTELGGTYARARSMLSEAFPDAAPGDTFDLWLWIASLHMAKPTS